MTKTEILLKYRTDRTVILNHISLIKMLLNEMQYLNYYNNIELTALKLSLNEFNKMFIDIDKQIKKTITDG